MERMHGSFQMLSKAKFFPPSQPHNTRHGPCPCTDHCHLLSAVQNGWLPFSSPFLVIPLPHHRVIFLKNTCVSYPFFFTQKPSLASFDLPG